MRMGSRTYMRCMAAWALVCIAAVLGFLLGYGIGAATEWRACQEERIATSALGIRG